MRSHLYCNRLPLAVALALASALVPAHCSNAAPPRVFILDGDGLRANRQRIRAGDDKLGPALRQLKRNADRALLAGPFSVVNKEFTPPSGDKHDYISLAPYWWPNPDSPDGLPYIRRDGERNPEIYKIPNRRHLGEMADAVDTLALAYYFTGDQRYAERTRLLLRTWFLDPATRMNPNLQFGQGIPGINTGRGIGLIETRMFARVVDAIGLVEESAAWTDDDQGGMEEWFDAFLTWMLESEHGRDEAAAENNHGTYYDVQVASFALFLGKKDVAAEVLRNVGTKRIAVQIEPDGRQPLELARTKAWSYSVANLAGLMTLARLGEHVGVDLWNFQTDEGAGLRAALDFLTPYGAGEERWPYKQMGGFDRELIYPLMRQAAAIYDDARYRALVNRMSPLDPQSRTNLLLSPLDPIAQLHTR